MSTAHDSQDTTDLRNIVLGLYGHLNKVLYKKYIRSIVALAGHDVHHKITSEKCSLLAADTGERPFPPGSEWDRASQPGCCDYRLCNIWQPASLLLSWHQPMTEGVIS
jgi:hypothetical protein